MFNEESSVLKTGFFSGRIDLYRLSFKIPIQ